MHADPASRSCNYESLAAINQNGRCHLLGTAENGAIQTFHPQIAEAQIYDLKTFSFTPRYICVHYFLFIN